MSRFSKQSILSNDHGSLTVETLLCLPLIFIIPMFIFQLTFIQLCRQMVVYASFVAARAVLPVHEDEEKDAAFYAARLICSTISFTGPDRSNDLKTSWLSEAGFASIPGSSGVAGTPQNGHQATGRYGAGKLAVSVNKPDNNYKDRIRSVTVYMDVPLFFPAAGMVFGGLAGDDDFYISGAETRSYCQYGYPHLRLRHTTIIGKNTVLTQNNLSDNYAEWNGATP